MSLLQVRGLHKRFPVRGGVLNRVVANVHAVNGVDFDVAKGEVLGIVGESGCGKSTLGKCIIQLHPPSEGEIHYDGQELTGKSHSQLMPFRRRIQMVFQDPYSSLNPRLTVEKLLEEVIAFHEIVPAAKRSSFIDELIAQVGLRDDAREKFPHEFSGGQRQRIGIARALALRPELLIADEPVSALDVSIQAQVLNLMMELKEQLDLTLIFISHDLKVIEHFCDRVLVMYLGYVVEELSCEELHERAAHPYTQALLGANPVNHPRERRELVVTEGDVPSPIDLPAGCPFASRCPLVEERCRHEMPELESLQGCQRVACWAAR
jgi:oligopeptide/dipeptide ABC transporter ATP-binding protein